MQNNCDFLEPNNLMSDAIFWLKENPFVSQSLIMAYMQTE